MRPTRTNSAAAARLVVLCVCTGLLAPSHQLQAEEPKPAETPAAESKPADPERVRDAIARLGSADFDTRSQAQQDLLKMGSAVWPQLEPFLASSEDPEVRARLTKLSQVWGIILAADLPRAKALLEKVCSKDSKERIAGADGLLAMGKGGIGLLQEILSGEHAKPELRLTFDKPAISPGETITGTVTLTNTGDAPLWFLERKYVEPLSIYWGYVQPFGEKRKVTGVGGGGGGAFGQSVGRYRNPIWEWRPIVKGDSIEKSDARKVTQETTFSHTLFGTYRGSATSSFPGGTIQPRLDPALPATIKLEIGKKVPEELAKGSIEEPYYVVPDLKAATGDEYLSMSITTSGKTVKPGGTISANVTLTSLCKEAHLRIEEDVFRYAWYAVLDEQHVPVSHGSLASAMKDKDLRTAALSLGPKEALSCTLTLDLPKKAGSYTLVAGYEADGSATFGQVAGGKAYDQGRLWASAGTVTVRAAEPEKE
ncbi:MAG: hypothetical protein KIS92_20685 [Planctomycetota bacterium]|nr:hypothetical protein [Planctomycetota bacterium]